jgi:hypothetical protein
MSKKRVVKTFADLLKALNVNDFHIPSASGDGKKKKAAAGEWDVPITVSKMDADKQQVFGWASIAMVNGQYVVDKHEDVIPVEELEKAAYDFVLNFREQDDMHVGNPTGRCIESVVYTPEKSEQGLVAKNDKGEQVFGWWVGFQVDDPELWKACKEGRRPEFSIGGSARKEKVE